MNSSASDSQVQGVPESASFQPPIAKSRGCSVTSLAAPDKAPSVSVSSWAQPAPSQPPVVGGPSFCCTSPGVVRRSTIGSASPMLVWPPGVASASSAVTPSSSNTTAQVLARLNFAGPNTAAVSRSSGAWPKMEEGKTPPKNVMGGEEPLQRLAREMQILEQLKAAVIAQEERVRQLRREVQLTPRGPRAKPVGVQSPQATQYPSGVAVGLQQAPLFPAPGARVSCNSVCRSIHTTPSAQPPPSMAVGPPPGRNYRRSSVSPSRDAAQPCPAQAQVSVSGSQGGGSIVLSHTSVAPGEDSKATCNPFGQRQLSPTIGPRKVRDGPGACQPPGGWPSPPPFFCRPEVQAAPHQPFRLPM
jgi:hypothetical protein